MGRVSNLSILCVTRGEECILPLLHSLAASALYLNAELVIVADGAKAHERLIDSGLAGFGVDRSVIPLVNSQGYIESVLDEAISFTHGDYILRIDDDESLSEPLIEWLSDREYEMKPHWKFTRANLYRDVNSYISNLPLFPDHQTRLSTRELSLGRNSIHCGSPHGGGELCPWPILHHKFLVKSLDERREIVTRYDKIYPGSGTNFLAFSLPEVYYNDRQEEIILCPVSEIM